MIVKEAVFAIENLVTPTNKTEQISLIKALNRVISHDFFARINVPRFDNSALDGYAFAYDDKDLPLEVVGAIFAGDVTDKIGKNECTKIMTGAPFPQGADTVVMFEDAKFDENERLLIPKDIKKFNACRFLGEEIKEGDLLIKKGEILTSSKIMLIASQGFDQICVYKRPKIAIFSSGNEIVEPQSTLGENQIYNANSFGTIAMLENLGFECEYKGIVKDLLSSIKDMINLCEEYDFIITSGGASKGDADFMKQALHECGFKNIIDGIKIKLGKPTKIFKKNSCLVFVLPGNPTAAFLIAQICLLPSVARFSHFRLKQDIKAKFVGELKLNPSRANFIIGIYHDGKFTAVNDNKFSPSQISPLTKANAFAMTEVGVDEICNDDEIFIKRLY